MRWVKNAPSTYTVLLEYSDSVLSWLCIPFAVRFWSRFIFFSCFFRFFSSLSILVKFSASARLSTAMAKKTFSKMSVVVQLRKFYYVSKKYLLKFLLFIGKQLSKEKLCVDIHFPKCQHSILVNKMARYFKANLQNMLKCCECTSEIFKRLSEVSPNGKKSRRWFLQDNVCVRRVSERRLIDVNHIGVCVSITLMKCNVKGRDFAFIRKLVKHGGKDFSRKVLIKLLTKKWQFKWGPSMVTSFANLWNYTN